jgi:hypothetical protein
MRVTYGLSNRLYAATAVPVSIRRVNRCQLSPIQGLTQKSKRGRSSDLWLPKCIGVSPETHESAATMGRWDRARSVSASSRRRRLERLRALVTEKVVAGEDVVDLQAFGARVALADVALEERVVANDVGSPSIAQEALRCGAAAGLAEGRVVHREIHRGRWGHDAPVWRRVRRL